MACKIKVELFQYLEASPASRKNESMYSSLSSKATTAKSTPLASTPEHQPSGDLGGNTNLDVTMLEAILAEVVEEKVVNPPKAEEETEFNELLAEIEKQIVALDAPEAEESRSCCEALDEMRTSKKDSCLLRELLAMHGRPEVAVPHAKYPRDVKSKQARNGLKKNSGGVPSRGSKNHALHMCRPCRYFSTAGGCPHGVLCNFCHFPHIGVGLRDGDQGTILHETGMTKDAAHFDCSAGKRGFGVPMYVPSPSAYTIDRLGSF